MSSETNNRSDKEVWTRRSIMRVAVSFAAILALAIVSYHVPAAAETTPTPVNADASAPGRQPR